MFPSNAFQVPSIQQFITELIAVLVQRRSLLVLLPPGLDSEEIWGAIRAELWRREFEFRELSMIDLMDEDSPRIALERALEFEWSSTSTPRTLPNLLANGRLPDIISISDFCTASESVRERWLEFLATWAEANKSRAGQGEPASALCIIA